MTTKSWIGIVAGLALVAAGCKDNVAQSGLNSGGGTNPIELGCEGLQANLVDDGRKFDAALAKYNSLISQFQQDPASPQPKPTSGDLDSSENAGQAKPTTGDVQGGNQNNHSITTVDNSSSTVNELALADELEQWNGVDKKRAYVGELGPIVGMTKMPDGISTNASCSRFSGKQPNGLYDACSEIVIYRTRLLAIASAWDKNLNDKKCYEGSSFDKVKSPEFGYCDNQCAFNDQTCYACDVKYNTGDGVATRTFICKSRETATDAIGGFCRNTGIKCKDYDPATACRVGKGSDFAQGTSNSIGGLSQDKFEAALSGYLGASEEVKVSAGISAGQKLEAKGTVVGKVGYLKTQGVGSIFTPSGYGASGLKVKCFLEVAGVGSVTYDYKVGVGGDFVFASGEATVNAGGSFSLAKAYTKYSPEFSGAGQDSNTIFDQCLRNYLPTWVGVEMQNWVDQYSGLKVIQQGINRVVENLGLDSTTMVDTNEIFCTYPSYDAKNAYRTGNLWVYLKDGYLNIEWSHHLRGWLNQNSGQLRADTNAVRPFLKDVKDKTLTGQRLLDFFNQVVVPASSAHQTANWRLSGCQL